jgi:type VI secretion system protein ImpL
LAALNELAKKAPMPVQQWLQELSNECWQVILKGAHQEMNLAWQARVMSIYHNNLRGRYPLNVNAESNIKSDAFNSFFGNLGVLDQYFNDYIQPFVLLDGQSLKWVSRDHLAISLPQSTLDCFQKVLQVRKGLFPNGSKMAQLNFSIQPRLLDSRASGIKFKIGEQTLHYSHGLQILSEVSWPLPPDFESIQITMKTFDSGAFSYQYSDFWSLMRMIQKGVLKAESKNAYTWTLNFKGYTATYEIKANTPESISAIIILRDFKLPEVLNQ